MRRRKQQSGTREKGSSITEVFSMHIKNLQAGNLNQQSAQRKHLTNCSLLFWIPVFCFTFSVTYILLLKCCFPWMGWGELELFFLNRCTNVPSQLLTFLLRSLTSGPEVCLSSFFSECLIFFLQFLSTILSLWLHDLMHFCMPSLAAAQLFPPELPYSIMWSLALEFV